MKQHTIFYALTNLALVLAAGLAPANAQPKLTPGATFAVQFPEMPPTYYAVDQNQTLKAQMTVYLPTNYDPAKKYPLFIFLGGGNGGGGGGVGTPREVTGGKDFICVNTPLFIAPASKPPGKKGLVIITAADGKYMWPFFKTMLDKLEQTVPNIDPAHRVLGGFSNGAHATAALLEGSNGEVARRFSGFLFGEGGGKLEHYDLLKGKTVLVFSSNAKSKPRAMEICETAKGAGALATFQIEDVGAHDFPKKAYPAIGRWLREAAAK